MDTLATSSGNDAFFHVRILLGMIVGLALTQLLRGVARIIEQPRQHRPYWIHLLWVVSMFLYLLHFWWWEFNLGGVARWTFGGYLFLALYALLLYLVCTLLFPERIDHAASYRDYYYSRRSWLFGTLAMVYLADIADTWLKGVGYFRELGTGYLWRNSVCMAACLIAMMVRKPAYHAVLVLAVLLYQCWWIAQQFEIS